MVMVTVMAAVVGSRNRVGTREKGSNRARVITATATTKDTHTQIVLVNKPRCLRLSFVYSDSSSFSYSRLSNHKTGS